MKRDIQSPTAILRAEIEAWRTANRLSREGVAIMILDAHEKSGADIATEINFDFGGDSYERAKKAAQKIFRWLDEGNLPANMLPSILAALPTDLRLHCMNEMFRPLGVTARSSEVTDGADFDAAQHASALVRENSEGVVALLAAGANPTPSQLKAALKEVSDVRETASATERALLAQLEGTDAQPSQLRSVS
jgi:hypothetical protein